MTQPIAGWYTDPAGDTTKLRYWDGTKWTDSLMDAPAPQPAVAPAIEEPVATAAASEPSAQPTPDASAYDAAYQQPVGQPAYTSAQQTQPGVPGPTVVSQDTYAPIYVNYGDAPLYYVSPQDSTLRLVAFVLALISTICVGFAIIPLAWMIPMTVMTWQIYKGKRANTVAFGVCSLIFLDLVTGILLLASTKEE